MLMSFKPSVYENILNGTKIFEHRRSFPDEPIKAYMYVSSPVCAITGILYLGKRHNLADWEKEYGYDLEAIERIKKYETDYRYAMEISQFYETTKIELNQLRNELTKFVVPQMYYYLDDSELLSCLESHLKNTGKCIEHNFDTIQSSQVCVH